MANQFKTTNVSGTFTVNGVEIGASSGEAQAALAQRAIRDMLGAPDDADGVIGGGQHTNILKVSAQSSPDLTVQVGAGTCFVGGIFTGDNDGVASLSGFAAPTTNPRIDIVQIDNTGAITRKAGTENASPSAPAVDTDNLLLATVYCRVGMTSVKDADDASNGYITDARVFV